MNSPRPKEAFISPDHTHTRTHTLTYKQKQSRDLLTCMYLSLPRFPFVRGEVLPATSSPPHLIVFSTLMSLVFFFFQSSSSPVFLTSLLTQSFHLSLGLPLLLLPYSRNSVALFGSLSSAILSTCPAHCSLLLTSLYVKLLCTHVSSLNSTILLLSALVPLAIFRTQLFSHTCSLCWMYILYSRP